MTHKHLALLAAAIAGAACGKQTFLAAAFVQTPTLPNPQDPTQAIPGFQVMTAYFGTIDTRSPTKIDPTKMAPITDAAASVSFRHVDAQLPAGFENRWLKSAPPWSTSGGTYTLSSKNEPKLTFEAGVPYTLVLVTCPNAGQPGVSCDSEAFGARFTPGPAADIREFQTSSCSVNPPIGPPVTADRCIQAPIGRAAMTITRTDTPAAGEDWRPAFVMVGRFDPQNPGNAPQITYQTIPDSAEKLLKYVLSDRDYRWPSWPVPESAFPQSGFYAVTLLTAGEGKVSGNAFLGSTALAAGGVTGVVIVQ
jgi:hypothetical protein